MNEDTTKIFFSAYTGCKKPFAQLIGDNGEESDSIVSKRELF